MFGGLMQAFFALNERERGAAKALAGLASTFGVAKIAKGERVQHVMAVLQGTDSPAPWMYKFANSVDIIDKVPDGWVHLSRWLESGLQAEGVSPDGVVSLFSSLGPHLGLEFSSDSDFATTVTQAAHAFRDRIRHAPEGEAGPSALVVCPWCSKSHGISLPR